MARTLQKRLEKYYRTRFPHEKDESKYQLEAFEQYVNCEINCLKQELGNDISSRFSSLLAEDEEILFLTDTVHLWEPTFNNWLLSHFNGARNEEWVICLTNQKIIAFSCGFFWGLILAKKTRTFPLKNIHSVQFRKRLFNGNNVILQANQTKVHITGAVEDLFQKLNSQLNQQTQANIPVPPPVAQQPNTGNALEQLERLSQLYQQGVLTEQEFQEQKQRILKNY